MFNKKNTFSSLGYFKYFKSFVGKRTYIYIFLNFLVGLFDSFGLVMFIPLMALATKSKIENDSLGKLEFLVDVIHSLGLELNLSIVLIFMMLLFTFKAFFYYIKGNYLNETLLIAQKNIRFKLVDGLKNLSYEGYTKLDVGRTQNNLVAETAKFMGAMNSYFMTIQHIVMLLTYILLAVLSNWKFSLMVAAGALITNFLYKYLNKITKELARKLTNVGHDFNGKIIQTVQNFKYLKATNKYGIFERKLKKDIEISEKMNYKMARISSIGESLREPLVIGVIAVVLYVQVEVFHNNFTSILVSLLLFYRSLGYLISMQVTWSSFIRSSSGIDSIELTIKEFKENKENHSDSKFDKIGNLKIENLNLKFGNKQVLKDLSFEIPRNKSVAFVGQSGAGKTTLANVLCGLQKPTQGKIFNDQLSLYDSNLDSYRDKVGYITQEPVIFNDTLFNNVTLWDDKTEESIRHFEEIIAKVDLLNFYKGLELRENTPLGNNGVLISGGQKQRVSIARELYKDSQLLIMDEATSALDSETEKNIKESIDMLQGNFTLLIIAHRLSTIKNVDKIYLMNEGIIEASGSYQELYNNSPKFKKMVELQDL